MFSSLMVLAYLGPETMLPMTSVVAGVAGVAMLFGRNSMRWALNVARRLFAMARPRPKPRTRTRKIGTGTVGSIERPRTRV